MSFQKGNNKPQLDKVNMSLDDIIKVNRKETNRPGVNSRNGNNTNNNRKPYGIINKSKNIQKNGRFNNRNNLRNNSQRPQGQKQQQPNNNGNNTNNRLPRKRPTNFNLNRRMLNSNNGGRANNQIRRPNNRFNRFRNQQQQQQVPRNNAGPKRIRTINNNLRANNLASRLSIQPASVPIRSLPIRVETQQQPRRINANKNNNVAASRFSNKIAMQTARKNIQKAKRLLLASKRKIGQIAASQRMAPRKPAPFAARRPNIRRAPVAKRVGSKMVRVNIKPTRKPGQQQKQPQQVKRFRPIIKRNRGPQAAGVASNRMVLY